MIVLVHGSMQYDDPGKKGDFDILLATMKGEHWLRLKTLDKWQDELTKVWGSRNKFAGGELMQTSIENLEEIQQTKIKEYTQSILSTETMEDIHMDMYDASVILTGKVVFTPDTRITNTESSKILLNMRKRTLELIQIHPILSSAVIVRLEECLQTRIARITT